MRTSPSQVKTAHRAMRKWAFGSIYGVWEPQKKDAADGDDVHGHLHAYMKFGQKFDMSDPNAALASLARDILPTRADEPLLEDENKADLLYAGHDYTVKRDVMWLGPSGPVVMDFKTCKNFKYALTKPGLRSDHQACCYALEAMDRYKYDHCTMVWVYLQKADPETNTKAAMKVVEVVIEREDAIAVMRAYHPTAQKMAEHKKKRLPILEIECNLDACKDYKGCWYRPKCFPEGYQYDENGQVQER